MSKLPRFIRLPEVKKLTGLSRSTIYDPNTGFPKPVKIGIRASGWVEDEVGDWLRSRMSERGR